jgi:hypothetical protein
VDSTEIRIILDYFETQKPYLKKGLNISQVAVEINISSKLCDQLQKEYLLLNLLNILNMLKQAI